MQLNFDIPTPFVSEPKPERKKPQRREKTESPITQDTQLDLLTDAPRRPEPPQPKHLSRPEHKPYEPNAECRQDLFEATDAFLIHHTVFHEFSWFLSQKCPSGKKERLFQWEGKPHKVVNYRWREFEGDHAIYGEWCVLYDKHLLGWTTNHFRDLKWERDFITERIEDGLTTSNNLWEAFIQTLKRCQFTHEEARRAWNKVKQSEKLKS